MEYASSEEEEERALNQSFHFEGQISTSNSPKCSPQRHQRISLQQSKKKRQAKAEAAARNGSKPVRTKFRSEYEFFLHYLWSQKGFYTEDMSDEYHNLNNPLSTATLGKPWIQHAALKAQHPNEKHQKMSYFRAQKDDYLKRVPMSFNFHVPQTLIVEKGVVKRWYYSNTHGLIKLNRGQKDRDGDWSDTLISSKPEEKGPSLLTYKLNEDEMNSDDEPVDVSEDDTANKTILKDILSTQRANNYVKHVKAHSFPKGTHIVQEMLMACNMKPAISNLTPGLQQLKNVASNHEIFEVHWQREKQGPGQMQIFRIRNLLKKTRFHLASSKSQMNSQIKPIRLKHGSVNPAKALLLKLNVPQQFLYLSHEQGQNFCERTQILPNPDRYTRRSSNLALHPIEDSDSFNTSFNKRSATQRPLGALQSSFMSNFNSPKIQKQMTQKQDLLEASEEIENEAKTAIRLIQAQFMLHQLKLQEGTFFLQWVHQEAEAQRDPTHPVEKRLYLVYAQDLAILDRNERLLPLPRRTVNHHKDALSKHFEKLVQSHANLKIREKNHEEVCSCKIQIDLSPKVEPALAEIYHRLHSANPFLHFRVMKLETKMLAALEYLLGITEVIDQFKEEKRDRQLAVQVKNKEQLLELRLEQGNDCMFCYEGLQGRKYWLPLAHLIYMPQQEAYFESLGESIPFETREKLILPQRAKGRSNKDLSPFLRILIPKLTVSQLQSLQNDEDWLNQKVYLSKKCYTDLSQRIVHLARQSIRLDEVQTDFQRQMLNILKRGGGTSNNTSNVRRKSQQRARTQQMGNLTARSNYTTSSFNKETSHSPSRDQAQNRRLSKQSMSPDKFKIQGRRQSNKSNGSSPQKQIWLSNHEVYEYAMNLGIKIPINNGQKRANPKEVIQLIQAKQATEGIPITNLKLRKKMVVVDMMSESEDEVEQMLQKMKETTQEYDNALQGTQTVRSQNRQSFKLKERTSNAKVQFQEQLVGSESGFDRDEEEVDGASGLLKVQAISMIAPTKSKNDLRQHSKKLASSFSSTFQNATIQPGQHDRVLRTSLREEMFQQKQQRLQADVSLMSLQEREKLVLDIVRPQKSANKTQLDRHDQRQKLLEQMKLAGDETFQEEDQTVNVLKRNIKDHIRAPLFNQSTIPSINSHRELQKHLSQTNVELGSESRTQSKILPLAIFDDNKKKPKKELGEKQLKRVRSDIVIAGPKHVIKVSGKKKRNKDPHHESQDLQEDIVKRLLMKHVPDYDQRAKTKRSHTNSPMKTPQSQRSTSSIEERKASQVTKYYENQKKRRKELIEKIKAQDDGDDQADITQEMADQFHQKRASIREMNWKKQSNPSRLGPIVNAPFEEPSAVLVTDAMPQLVSARSLHSFEISRLTNDPIFGAINKAKIVKADQVIRNSRIKEDPGYKASMETFKQRIKNPVTKDDFELKKEHEAIKECEKLVTEMDHVLHEDKFMKPAAVRSWQEFMLTGRLGSSQAQLPLKSKMKKNGLNSKETKKAELMVKEAERAISFVQYLKQREQDIVLEENALHLKQKESISYKNSMVFDNSRNANLNQTSVRRLSMTGDKFASDRAMNLIKIQHEVNDQDAKNQVNLHESLLTLESIDKNIMTSTKVLGRSKTVGLLPKVNSGKKVNKLVYRNTLGLSVSVGKGRATVVAKDQSQANFINMTKKHLSSKSDFKLTEIFH